MLCRLLLCVASLLACFNTVVYSNANVVDSNGNHHASKVELQQIWNIMQKDDTLSCPSVGGSKDYAHHLLTYKTNSPEYENLNAYNKTTRIKDEKIYWIRDFCPEVYEYFSSRVSYFDYWDGNEKDIVLTPSAAMTSVCMLKVIDLVAKRIKMDYVLLAGSQLGAVLHGGPIPWDDDIDIMIDYEKKEEFMTALSNMTISGEHFSLFQAPNAIKMWIDNDPF